MSPLRIVLYVVLIILSVFVTILVLMQEGKQQGLGSLAGSSAETYWGKNKGRSVEGKLVRYTAVLATLLIVLAAVLNMSNI